MLLTKIVVFDSLALDDYDSAITYPAVLRDLGEPAAGNHVEFLYVADEKPRFQYRLTGHWRCRHVIATYSKEEEK